MTASHILAGARYVARRATEARRKSLSYAGPEGTLEKIGTLIGRFYARDVKVV